MKVLANDGISKSGIEALEKGGFEVITTTVAQEQLVNYINENNFENNPDFGIMLLTADTVSSCVPRTQGQYETIINAIFYSDRRNK
jgi:hypothetical protein